MAIFHFNMRVHSRIRGKSALDRVAYFTGIKIEDPLKSISYNYSNKRDVEASRVYIPGGKILEGNEIEFFWRSIDLHYKRRDSIVARSVDLALVKEFCAKKNVMLAYLYAEELSNRYGVGVLVSVHRPKVIEKQQSCEGDILAVDNGENEIQETNGNWHAHFLITCCSVISELEFGRKVERLDPICAARSGGLYMNPVQLERYLWCKLLNQTLEDAKINQKVSHLSLAAQGIDREPSRHIGPRGNSAHPGKPTPTQQRLKEESKDGYWKVGEGRDISGANGASPVVTLALMEPDSLNDSAVDSGQHTRANPMPVAEHPFARPAHLGILDADQSSTVMDVSRTTGLDSRIRRPSNSTLSPQMHQHRAPAGRPENPSLFETTDASSAHNREAERRRKRRLDQDSEAEASSQDSTAVGLRQKVDQAAAVSSATNEHLLALIEKESSSARRVSSPSLNDRDVQADESKEIRLEAPVNLTDTRLGDSRLLAASNRGRPKA